MRSQRADLDHLQVEADTELNEALKDHPLQALPPLLVTKLQSSTNKQHPPTTTSVTRITASAAKTKTASH